MLLVQTLAQGRRPANYPGSVSCNTLGPEWAHLVHQSDWVVGLRLIWGVGLRELPDSGGQQVVSQVLQVYDLVPGSRVSAAAHTTGRPRLP